MTTPDPSTARRAAETTRRYREAVEAADIEGLLATLAPDVVLHSPITMRTQFRGHDEMRGLMRAVFASIEDISYFEDVRDATTRALFYRAHVGRQDVEEATLLRLDGDALITEIRLWFRPLPGLATVMGKLGPLPGPRARARPRRGRCRPYLAAGHRHSRGGRVGRTSRSIRLLNSADKPHACAFYESSRVRRSPG